MKTTVLAATMGILLMSYKTLNKNEYAEFKKLLFETYETIAPKIHEILKLNESSKDDVSQKKATKKQKDMEDKETIKLIKEAILETKKSLKI